jgi:hypothetical protein
MSSDILKCISFSDCKVYKRFVNVFFFLNFVNIYKFVLQTPISYLETNIKNILLNTFYFKFSTPKADLSKQH